MMDYKFSGMGFSANCSLHALQNRGGVFQGEHGADDCVDTILRLDSLGYSASDFPISKGVKRNWVCINGNMGQQAKRSLGFGVGHYSPSSSEGKRNSATTCTAISFAKEIGEESSVDLDLEFSLHFGIEKSPIPKKATASNLEQSSSVLKVDLELSLSTGPSESDVTSVHVDSPVMHVDIEEPLGVGGTQLDDDSPFSLGKSDDLMPPFHASRMNELGVLFKAVPKRIDSFSFGPGLSASTTSASKSSVTCTSGLIQPQRGSSSKLCKFTGCSKGARGSSGLCISHGGGRRCQRPDCDKGAEGKTAFCKAHGGGRRCQHLGCTKSAEGRTEFCIAHGGGRRCGHDGCTKAARGKSGLCIRHGGGKRCQRENCTRSAEGLSGLCISHGGGRRCQYTTCTKGAQGSTMFCKAHGGGKRCSIEGCTKGAEGSTNFCKGHGGGKRCSFPGCPKSVHGGTSFCVAHGGGKRCAIHGCTKSARGKTDFCVRHGGGKRCTFDGCSKSAQGSTNFCKAHGGGKRCSWGQLGSQCGNVDDGPCGSFARGKSGLCSVHGALVQDKRIHGGITVGPLVQVCNSSEDIQTVSEGDMDVRSLCGEATSVGWSAFDVNQKHCPSAAKGLSTSPVPEGRVHGGSLLAMLTGGSGLVSG